MTDQEFINNSLYETIEYLLNNNSHIILREHNDTFALVNKSSKNYQWMNAISTEIILNKKNELTLYYSVGELVQFQRYHSKTNFIYFKIDENIQEDFFNTWLTFIPKEYMDEFLSIAGKVIKLSIRLKSLQNNKNLFKKQFTIKKKNIVSSLDNVELQKVLSILDITISDLTEKEQLLFIFCKNNIILFKRIEGQLILDDFIDKTFINDRATIKNTFINYLHDVNKASSNYFDTVFPSFFFRLNKKDLFSNLYHSNITDKFQLVILMNEIQLFFSESSILKKYHLDKVYLSDTEVVSPSFTWIFYCNQFHSPINYQLFLKRLIDGGAEHLGQQHSREHWKELFTTMANHYFLSLSLKDNPAHKKRNVKKI